MSNTECVADICSTQLINDYVAENDWRVKENANAGYSYASLINHLASTVIAKHVLSSIYPEEIAEAHQNGDFHLHDLGCGIVAYCAGWSLRELLIQGFKAVHGRSAAGPARHFDAALLQLANFLCTLQTEWAGAQAVSSFDTLLAPFVRADNLDYRQIEQNIQQFVFGLNVASRMGQSPFSNITLDWTVPEDIKDNPVIICGVPHDSWKYKDFQKEMDLINKAFLTVMAKGDQDGRPFTFPIPTYNITRDFDWDSENARLLFEVTGKYGIPYFQNFVNSDLKPTDVRSMCCRLRLDMKTLAHKTGGLFGSGEQTGSIGVVTINMPRLGYLYKDNKEELKKQLEHRMVLAKDSLELKRKVVTENFNKGLMPYSRLYLPGFDRHFSTIGLVGMNELCLNFMGKSIAEPEGRELAEELLEFMRDKLKEFQDKTGNIYNLESSPAEGTSYRLAKIDKEKYPDIITAGSEVPYYTNSTNLPVGFTSDIFEALDLQEKLQCCYTGGTVFHGFIGERIEDPELVARLVKTIAYRYRIPYFTITPTFSICPVHGYIPGEHHCCPFEE